ncbi:nitrogen fixation protein NifX [Cereibacter sphaeroides]|uniref:nitrogen fixation protein NifX n=1 Tax=Cereibacter sphaeroides TaxID=1063 RepID=UPI001F36FCA6|nr:nitrogen fixation protein NifX [Cereibacter sphaeroides]MCE6958205.1 nitrogen fixation protein NifX [Cereibacter sphaeroides]MCE6967684.1 nitrogen fixation protein NifX [Cereibacter sphaeroides]MCE6972495.1 nitrogen fixation protein NifX [Cereibacter sphaeroides]
MNDPADAPLRIAIATNDLEHLDAHFGSCRSFAIWEVSARSARFVEAVEFDATTDQGGKHDDSADRITPKVEALTGCALLFVLAIGGPAAAKVVRAGVHPIKRKDPEPIAAVIGQVQTMLNGNIPPFLRKVLGRPAPSFMEEEAQ